MKLIKDLGIRSLGNYSKRFGLYKCPKCDKNFEAMTANVKKGTSTQCRACASTKHNMYNSLIYSKYHNMIGRCYNENNLSHTKNFKRILI